MLAAVIRGYWLETFRPGHSAKIYLNKTYSVEVHFK
jgi:hypothetical protein